MSKSDDQRHISTVLVDVRDKFKVDSETFKEKSASLRKSNTQQSDLMLGQHKYAEYAYRLIKDMIEANMPKEVHKDADPVSGPQIKDDNNKFNQWLSTKSANILNDNDTVKYIGTEEQLFTRVSGRLNFEDILNNTVVVTEIDYEELDCKITTSGGYQFMMDLGLLEKVK
jgi:hypothetical protein